MPYRFAASLSLSDIRSSLAYLPFGYLISAMGTFMSIKSARASLHPVPSFGLTIGSTSHRELHIYSLRGLKLLEKVKCALLHPVWLFDDEVDVAFFF